VWREVILYANYTWNSSEPANRGGVMIPAITALSVVAFGTWVKDVKCCGQAVEAVLFTNEVLETFKERLNRPDKIPSVSRILLLARESSLEFFLI
jgi:hypothetical protein